MVLSPFPLGPALSRLGGQGTWALEARLTFPHLSVRAMKASAPPQGGWQLELRRVFLQVLFWVEEPSLIPVRRSPTSKG